MRERYVYVIGEDDGPQKIGLSWYPPNRRAFLARVTAKRLKLHHYAAVSAVDVYAVERLAHWRLRDLRLEGEWFNITPSAAAEEVEQAVLAFAAGDRAPYAEPKEVERATVIAPASMMARVEEWRRKQTKIPSKSEAIRMLVDQALANEARRGK
ncbi:hypothetical protein ASE63_22625 [Bosea sp. Root381]|uniref:GIY-YIG nuclease family protein n=1 Tax=Bosea sp. Root381 TaxID=1736524 RepID=UPI0006FE55A4|nr:GIY-YIG nuclease family protein [Bosea sp. Root381]KRE07497.1 hypothetical protein ASE63_22625 [Bosea sp. Root381]